MENFDDENSGILFVEGTTKQTEYSSLEYIPSKEYETTGFNRLIKACRNGKWYILKCLKSPYNKQEFFKDQLHKESDILNMMSPKGVVKYEGIEDIKDLGECIVMEYVDGITLQEFIEQNIDTSGKEYLLTAKRIALQLAEAVAYIHSLQIVHRDLKPKNIMITNNGQNVKIIDFGLADCDNFMLLKQTAGTRNYMAPEQKAGAKADVRGDIYSFGIILRQLFAHNNLGRIKSRYLKIAQKCTLPIEQRYQHMDDVVADLHALSFEKPFYKQPFGIISCALAAILAIVMVVNIFIYNQKNNFTLPGTDIPRSQVDSLAIGYTNKEKSALESSLALFVQDRANLQERILEENRERESFLSTFTPDSIYNMTPQDFDIDNPNGFCNILRNKMWLMGNLTPFPLYTYYTQYIEDSTFINFKSQIMTLLEGGYENDEISLREDMLRTPLRFKLLSLYYPNFYLPILSDHQAQQIVSTLIKDKSLLQQLTPEGSQDARDILLQLHQHFSFFNNWSLIEFAYFLTNYYPGISYEQH